MDNSSPIPATTPEPDSECAIGNTVLSPSDSTGHDESSRETLALHDEIRSIEELKKNVETVPYIKESIIRRLLDILPVFEEFSDTLEWDDMWTTSLDDITRAVFKYNWLKLLRLSFLLMAELLASNAGLKKSDYRMLPKGTIIRDVSGERSFLQWIWNWHSFQPAERFANHGEIVDGYNHRLTFPKLDEDAWGQLLTGDAGKLYTIVKELLQCYPHPEKNAGYTMKQWGTWMMDVTWAFGELYEVSHGSEISLQATQTSKPKDTDDVEYISSEDDEIPHVTSSTKHSRASSSKGSVPNHNLSKRKRRSVA